MGSQVPGALEIPRTLQKNRFKHLVLGGWFNDFLGFIAPVFFRVIRKNPGEDDSVMNPQTLT